MYAEAANELNDGPTDAAKAALRQVRQRAFTNPEKIDSYIESMSGSKDDFLKAVLDERKFEFAGENMRWKDLVRNNLWQKILIITSYAIWFAVKTVRDNLLTKRWWKSMTECLNI